MLGVVIFFMALSLALIIGFAEPALRTLEDTGGGALSRQGYFAAESAAEDTAYRFMSGMQTDPLTGPTLNGATTSVSVAAGAGAQTITATGDMDGYLRSMQITLSGTSTYTLSGWSEQAP